MGSGMISEGFGNILRCADQRDLRRAHQTEEHFSRTNLLGKSLFGALGRRAGEQAAGARRRSPRDPLGEFLAKPQSMELQGWNPALTWLCGTPRNPNLEFPAGEKQVLACHSSPFPSSGTFGTHLLCPLLLFITKIPQRHH